MSLSKTNVCFCIKLPEGFTQNRYGEKFKLGNKYLFDLYDERNNIKSYRIYESLYGEPMLIRDEIWFQEHFATFEILRDKKIDEILS